MSEQVRELHERPDGGSFFQRVLRGLVVNAYEEMGVPAEQAAQAYEAEEQAARVEAPKSPSPADIARAAQAYDPDALARNLRGHFRRH